MTSHNADNERIKSRYFAYLASLPSLTSYDSSNFQRAKRAIVALLRDRLHEVQTRPLAMAEQSLTELAAGKIIGRVVLEIDSDA